MQAPEASSSMRWFSRRWLCTWSSKVAMLSTSGKPGWDTLYHPMPAGFDKARFNDIESVRRVLGRDTVAVMLELVQGEAGVNLAAAGSRTYTAACSRTS